MDGYAIRAADTSGAAEAAPSTLDVIGEVAGRVGVAAGGPFRDGDPDRDRRTRATGRRRGGPGGGDEPRGCGGRRRCDAGGMRPGRCRRGSWSTRSVPPGGSIRRAGSDVEAGALLREPGDVVTPAAVALARRLRRHGAGRATAPRGRGARDGRRGAWTRRGAGKRGHPRCERAGRPVARPAGGRRGAGARDREGRARGCRGPAARALVEAGADAIVVSGGVSVGPYDVVRLAFEQLGRIGLPVARRRAARQAVRVRGAPPATGRPVLLFGLPGNPVSSFVTFELFVRPALRRLAGHRDLLRPRDRAVLEEPVSKSPGRRGFQRVTALRDGDGGPERDGAGRVRVRLAGWAGEPRDVRPRGGGRARRRPGVGRPAAGRSRSGAALARPRLSAWLARPSRAPGRRLASA